MSRSGYTFVTVSSQAFKPEIPWSLSATVASFINSAGLMLLSIAIRYQATVAVTAIAPARIIAIASQNEMKIRKKSVLNLVLHCCRLRHIPLRGCFGYLFLCRDHQQACGANC